MTTPAQLQPDHVEAILTPYPMRLPGGVIHMLMAVLPMLALRAVKSESLAQLNAQKETPTNESARWVYHYAATAHNRLVDQFPMMPPASSIDVDLELSRSDLAIALLSLGMFKAALLPQQPLAFFAAQATLLSALKHTPSLRVGDADDADSVLKMLLDGWVIPVIPLDPAQADAIKAEMADEGKDHRPPPRLPVGTPVRVVN